MNRKELMAGITLFATSAYIAVVNPAILAAGTGMPAGGVLTATVIAIICGTLCVAAFVRGPYIIAPGMGMNTFFAATMVVGSGIPWQTALGICFWAGLALCAVCWSGAREKITDAVPLPIQLAAVVGIGLFLARIGLANSGIFSRGEDGVLTMFADMKGLMFVLGMLLLVGLRTAGKGYASLATIIAVTVAGAAAGDITAPSALWAAPDFSTLFALDLLGSLRLAYLPLIFAIVILVLCDGVGVMFGLSQQSGLADRRGLPLRLNEALKTLSGTTVLGAILGTSPPVVFLESGAAIAAGGRTGATATVAALCFLPLLFFAPVVGLIPAYATAPVLIMIAWDMAKLALQLPRDREEEMIPAAITALATPVLGSVAHGLMVGMVFYLLLQTIAGQIRQLKPLTVAFGVLSVVFLVIDIVLVALTSISQ